MADYEVLVQKVVNETNAEATHTVLIESRSLESHDLVGEIRSPAPLDNFLFFFFFCSVFHKYRPPNQLFPTTLWKCHPRELSEFFSL